MQIKELRVGLNNMILITIYLPKCIYVYVASLGQVDIP